MDVEKEQEGSDTSAAKRVPLLASSWMENDLIRCFLLLAIGFIVRIPALQGSPIWDDEYLLQRNPFAKSPLLIAEAFRHYLFLDSLAFHYRPVQNISIAFDYLVWNSNWYGYHLTSVLLHVASGVLLYFLLRKLLLPLLRQDTPTGRRTMLLCAFLVALLWVVHPVHSAAVDYISGRADSLAFFFATAAWLIYLRGSVQLGCRERIVHYAAAAVCGLLALCSRESACVWVCLFLIYNFTFAKNETRRTKLLLLISCVGMFTGYMLLRQLAEQRPPSTHNFWSAPVRLILMLRALGDYGRLIVWPSRLGMERNVFEPENYRTLLSWRSSASAEYLSVLGLVVLSALVYGACKRGAGQRMRVFGVVWFFAGFLPISNIVDLNATVAEHWLYLPSVGLLLFLAGCALELPLHKRGLVTTAAMLAVCALGVRAYSRSTDWMEPRTFYERTMASGGTSVRVAVNLAVIYKNDGQYARAESALRHVLQLVPDYPIARHNLADVLYKEGKEAEAKALLNETNAAAQETRKDYPRTWMAALKLATVRVDEHNEPGAIEILEQARRDYHEAWELVSAETELLRRQSGPDAALRVLAPFAQSHWWHYDATVAMAQLLAAKGEADAAAEELRFASWLDVHDTHALNLLAAMRFRQGRFADAYAAQQRAVARQPDEPSQYRFISQILDAMGRKSEAHLADAKMASLELGARAGN